MTFRYRCTCCGEWKDQRPAVAFDKPHYFFDIPEEERGKRVFITSDLCVLDDEDFFIRGVLEIPVIGSSETLEYGAWTSVSKENFFLYQKTFREDQAGLGPFFGWFSNELPGFPSTLSLKLWAHPRGKNQRPRLALEKSNHPLSVECQFGITVERLGELLSPYRLH